MIEGLEGRKVTVVGLARSGVGAANLLSAMGANVTVTDSKTGAELADFIAMLDPSVRHALSGHPESLFTTADMIVVSPGVPLDIPPLAAAKREGVPVIGELELAYQVLQSENLRMQHRLSYGKVPLLAVTGSNGKSTTTSLLNRMLRKGGFKTIMAGNIGSALTDEIHKMIVRPSELDDLQRVDCIVLEVSSFQLESITMFRPSVAALLNITPDHLDRYHSMDDYVDAKAGIFLNQRHDDYLVLNADDPESMRLYHSRLETSGARSPQICFFSRTRKVQGVYCTDGIVRSSLSQVTLSGDDQSLIPVSEIQIKGVHNLENAMAASAMALLAQCPVEAVVQALRQFRGLEHRLEFVRELDGVKYFNDSKGTNIGAVVKSLESFQEPLILIAGGRDKAGDFSVLRELVAKKVRGLVLIGEASGKIKSALGDVAETVFAEDMMTAVHNARAMAQEGDIVLLSPACASFDMFTDFEDRGRKFKAIIEGLH